MVELVAKRYGKALFDIAIEENTVDAMEEEVKGLITIIEMNEDILEILSHPQITTEKKEQFVEEIFAKNVSDHLLGMIDLTVKKGRQLELVSILKYFIEKVDEYHNIAKVHVTTVEAITDDYRGRLIEKLEKITKKTVVLEEAIDPSIIGGIIIRISDRIVDNSIKGQVNTLSKNLLINT